MVALALAGVGALGWRLSRGSLDLRILVPVLERALALPELGLAARIASAELAWDGAARRPTLRARDVRLLGARGETVARLEEIAVRPSGGALLHGSFAPSTIELIAPRLRIVRLPHGGVALGAGDGEDTGVVLPSLLASPGTAGPARWLRRIEVRHGDVLVTDLASDRGWHAVDARVLVERAAGAITLAATAGLRVGAGVVPVRADLMYRKDPPGAVGTVRVDRIEPADAAWLVPAGGMRSALTRLALPLSGTVHVELDGDLGPRRVRIDAEGGAGRIAAPETPAGEIRVRRLGVSALLDPADDRLRVETLALDLEPAPAAVSGAMTVTELQGARRFEIEARASDIATGGLLAWWPRGVERAAREAVTARIADGAVRDAAARLSGHAGDGGVVLDAVQGSARFHAVVARLPGADTEARGVAGTIDFTRDRWRFRVARGAIADVDVAHATLDLDVARRRGAVAVALRGPLASGLALARRVGGGRELGLDPADVRGTMAADVRVGFPLRAGRGEVDVVVSADLQRVAVARAFRGSSFTDGHLALAVRDGVVHVAGQGRLAGAPTSLVWEESARRGRARRRVEVAARLDSTARAALGLDLRPWLDGDVAARVDLTDEAGAGTVDLAADLTSASLDVPALRLRKTAGAPGTVEARVRLAGGLARAVDRFRFAAGNVSATASAELAADGRTVRTLDAAATFRAADAARPAGHLTLALVPDGARHRFTVGCDDAGAFFRALDPGGDATGGRLEYAGTVDLAAPGVPFDGHLALRDFTLLRAPLLARVATLGSLAGIARALEGKGIRFARLAADVGLRDKTISIAEGRAEGAAASVLVAGTVDRGSGTYDLRGTLVPSYAGLNTAPGRVPVVGRVLTGAGKEGIEVVDFTITGPIRSPRVSVNPLSLAPGALRDLFRRAPIRR